VPTGIVLAFDAKGGSAVTAGFLLSAAIVAWFMVRGVAAARRRDIKAHSRAMRHVFAQMSVVRRRVVGARSRERGRRRARFVSLTCPNHSKDLS
jgi:hypothetical protein